MDGRFAAAGALTLALRCSIAPNALADGADHHEDVEARPGSPHLTLPIESGHAAAWERERRGPVYRWSAAILPGLFLYERSTVHAMLQLNYRNPNWDTGLGGRVTFRFCEPLGGVFALRAVAEGAYLPIENNPYVAGGLMVGLGNLAHVVLLPGRDAGTERWFFAVRLGIDLTSLGDPIAAMTRFVPYDDLPRRGGGQ